jgi:aminoglycoside 6-adenylyltransferase
LDRSIGLLRRVALEVGEHLGYAYPHDLDRRTVAYLQKVKNLDHTAVGWVEGASPETQH